MVTIDRAFGRYPLSVILSFLEERDGLHLLQTNRRWYYQLLPIFRLPEETLSIIGNDHHQPLPSPRPLRRGRNEQYQFVVVPVQDATIRLKQLNTKRLYERGKRPQPHRSTIQLAQDEWKADAAVPPIPPLLRFLTKQDRIDNMFPSGLTLLVSYPRSGNTLLRYFLEQCTGFVTGSDTRPDRPLSCALAEKHGLVGEGICDDKVVLFCKTHWPERIGCQPYRGQRAILLVRNPWDAIDSYWNLNLTNTHTEKVTDEIYERFDEMFQKLVRNEFRIWLRFTQFWISQQHSIPLLLVRYEDLIQQPQRELQRILEFSLWDDADHQCLNEIWKNRISAVVTHHTSRQPSYGNEMQASQRSVTPKRPVSSSPLFGRSLRRYSTSLLEELHAMDTDGWLLKFGYDIYQHGFPNNFANTSCSSPSIDMEAILSANSSNGAISSVLVNQPEIDLRPRYCPYGRLMRDWRRGHTKDDTEPFPTVAR